MFTVPEKTLPAKPNHSVVTKILSYNSSVPPNFREVFFIFKTWTKRGVMKKLFKNRGGSLKRIRFLKKYTPLLQPIDLLFHLVYLLLKNDIL